METLSFFLPSFLPSFLFHPNFLILLHAGIINIHFIRVGSASGFHSDRQVVVGRSRCLVPVFNSFSRSLNEFLPKRGRCCFSTLDIFNSSLGIQMDLFPLRFSSIKFTFNSAVFEDAGFMSIFSVRASRSFSPRVDRDDDFQGVKTRSGKFGKDSYFSFFFLFCLFYDACDALRLTEPLSPTTHENQPTRTGIFISSPALDLLVAPSSSSSSMTFL